MLQVGPYVWWHLSFVTPSHYIPPLLYFWRLLEITLFQQALLVGILIRIALEIACFHCQGFHC